MSDLDRVLGRRPIQEVTTASAIPVVATVPASRHVRRPKKDDGDEKRKRHARLISGVLGMTESDRDGESLFPDDAEEADGNERVHNGINLKKPEFSQRNPDSPKDEEEQLLSPRAALVAPDVTPDSMTEIDPSDVPGPKANSFRVADTVPSEPPAVAPPGVAPAAAPALGGEDRFTSTMDTLLGRDRTQQPMPSHPTPPRVESAISPEAAAAMFTAPSGDALLAQGKPMADPVVGDGKTIFEAARRFM